VVVTRGKGPLGKSWRKWKDNIKVDPDCENTESTCLAQYKKEWWVQMDRVLILRVP